MPPEASDVLSSGGDECFLSTEYRSQKKRPSASLSASLPPPVLPGGAVLDLNAFATFIDSRGGYGASRRRMDVWLRARDVALRPGRDGGEAVPALDPTTMRMLYEIYVLPSEPAKRRRLDAASPLPPLGESDPESQDEDEDEDEDDEDDDDGFGCASDGDDDEELDAFLAPGPLTLAIPAVPQPAAAAATTATGPASPISSRSPSPATLRRPAALVSPGTIASPKASAPASPLAAGLLRGAVLAAVVRHAAAGQRVGALAALRLVSREWRAAVDAAPPALYAALAFDGLRIPDAPAPFLLEALRRAAAAGSAAALYGLALATGLGAAGAPRDPPAAISLAMRAAAAGHPRGVELAGRLAPLAPAAQ
eukprot:tig00021108_g18302.t1